MVSTTYSDPPEIPFDQFTKCPERLFFLGLNPPAFAVYLVLKSYDFRDKGVVWPKVPTVAAKANISERAAHRALRELEHIGLITTEHRPNKSSRFVLHDIEDIPLPAGSENSDVSTCGTANLAGLGVPNWQSQGCQIGSPGSAKLAVEVDKDKRSRSSRENQTQKPDKPAPPPAGASQDVGGQVPLRGGTPEEFSGALSLAKQTPPIGTDFLGLRQRLESHV